MRAPFALAVVCAGCGGSVAATTPNDSATSDSGIVEETAAANDTGIAVDSSPVDVAYADEGSVAAPLTVVTTHPDDGAKDVPLDQTFEIVFSRAIRLPPIGSVVVTSPVGVGAVSLALVGAATTLRVSSDHWPLNVPLTIHLSTAIVAVDGAPLDRAYDFTFEMRDGAYGTATTVMPHGISVALAADDRGGFGVRATSGIALLPAGLSWSVVSTAGTDDEEGTIASVGGRYDWGDQNLSSLIVDSYDPYGGAVLGATPPFLSDKVSYTAVCAGRGAWTAGATSTKIELFSLTSGLLRAEIPLSAPIDGYRVGLACAGDAIALAWSEGHRIHAALGTVKGDLVVGLDRVDDVADATGFGWPWQKVAVTADGSAFVVWADTAGVHRGHFDGSAWSVDPVASSGYYGVAASEGGDAIVDWSDGDGVHVARWDATKKAWEATTTWTTPGGEVHYGRAVALDAVGNALFAWRGDDGVHAARFDARTKSWRPDVIVAAPTTIGTFVTVALGPVGGMIAWEHPVVTALPFE